MKTRTGPEEALRCSFCHKSQDAVAKLISSPSDYPRAYICDECVAVCNSILEDDRGEPLIRPPPPATCPSRRRSRAFLDDYVIGQDQTKKKLAVAVYNHYKRIQMNRMRNNEVELAKQHPAHRPHRLGQNAAGAHAGQDARRALCHCGRDHADRSRLRGRGC
jgi:ATP-dependent Clp protease ATP-binding subunit ClpX